MRFNLNSEFRNDLKMIACREKYGLRGYGIYINILELMYEQGNANLPLDFHILALEMREDEDIVKSVIMDFNLFRIVKDKKEFFSLEVSQEIARKKELKEIRSKSANVRWHKEKKYQPPTPPVCANETASPAEPNSEKSITCLLEDKDKNRFATLPAPPPPITSEQAKEITQTALKKKLESTMTDTEKAEYDSLLHYFFFTRHIKDANAETARFWNFYNRIGWKDAKGRKIIDKMSTAKMWNTGQAPEFPSDTTAFISILKFVIEEEAKNISVFKFIQGIHRVDITEDKVILYTTVQIAQMLENNSQFQTDYKLFYKNKKLEYMINNLKK